MRCGLGVSTVLGMLAVIAADPVRAQTTESTAREVFHKALFVSYQSAQLSGVPISYAPGNANGLGGDRVKSSGTGSALGVGASWLLGDDRWLLQLGYDRASASFTDWRVSNRTIAFNSVDMTVGYALRGTVSVVPYLTVAPGWYTQSDFKKYSFTEGATGPGDDAYEALDDYDYYFAYSVGAKVAFARHFAVTAESRWYGEDTGGGCGFNCIEIRPDNAPPPERYGRRTSIGLQLYWGW